MGGRFKRIRFKIYLLAFILLRSCMSEEILTEPYLSKGQVRINQIHSKHNSSITRQIAQNLSSVHHNNIQKHNNFSLNKSTSQLPSKRKINQTQLLQDQSNSFINTTALNNQSLSGKFQENGTFLEEVQLRSDENETTIQQKEEKKKIQQRKMIINMKTNRWKQILIQAKMQRQKGENTKKANELLEPQKSFKQESQERQYEVKMQIKQLQQQKIIYKQSKFQWIKKINISILYLCVVGLILLCLIINWIKDKIRRCLYTQIEDSQLAQGTQMIEQQI